MFSGVFGSVGNNAGMRTIGSPMSLVRSHLPFPHPPSPPRDLPPGPDPRPGPPRFPPSWTQFPAARLAGCRPADCHTASSLSESVRPSNVSKSKVANACGTVPSVA